MKDEDLYKFLADLKRPSSVLKRLKCIPGNDNSLFLELLRLCLLINYWFLGQFGFFAVVRYLEQNYRVSYLKIQQREGKM